MDSGYFYVHKRKTLYYLNEITMRGSHFVPCLVVSSNGLCKFFSISFLYRRYPGLTEEEKNYYSEIAKVVYSFMSVWVCVSDCVRVTNCVCVIVCVKRPKAHIGHLLLPYFTMFDWQVLLLTLEPAECLQLSPSTLWASSCLHLPMLGFQVCYQVQLKLWNVNLDFDLM